MAPKNSGVKKAWVQAWDPDKQRWIWVWGFKVDDGKPDSRKKTKEGGSIKGGSQASHIADALEKAEERRDKLADEIAARLAAEKGGTIEGK